ncbi:MAG: 2,3-bisphosphoglycerate-dependent phosphoglycerate mutase [Nanoarchaeota archaeon]|nr:2,3-bisphosphoglycerate-dependent phosphoglycerate mutase [Nanoarchaeota archaeon]MBU1445039.1 2,3-bisphosphoglycerate-dependent phosphoglycerate mutase [Nanoarchaeota archaeon]MBU2420049.1 2,3-bisphosphoglycerate-dependent phosphoglycerate mutase [Nanoarchaeota archaeon]MBU2475471.1 2,3-bisphosphoglycerate-dependent phosphoglycerate mutase [Nanoarchaeota archaeon]
MKDSWAKQKLDLDLNRKTCKIYIFRHGQTIYNKKHIFSGWKDSKLTSQGKRDANKIAQKLKGKKFEVAFKTHLSRSVDTLKPVLKYHPECKLIIKDDRMLERNYGDIEGRTHQAYIHEEGLDSYKTLLHWHKIDHLSGKDKAKFIKKVGTAEFDTIHRSYTIPPPGGESIRDVEKRVIPFVKDLIKFMKKNKVNVAISAHGNSMRPFRRYFERLSVKQMMELENPYDKYFEYTIKC